jgi:hypothetical protein
VLEVTNPVVQQVVGKTKEVDQQRGISSTAGDYYEKALRTPFGRSIFDFYTTTSKQVADVHHEARRIADVCPPSGSVLLSRAPADQPTPLLPLFARSPVSSRSFRLGQEKKSASTAGSATAVPTSAGAPSAEKPAFGSSLDAQPAGSVAPQ